MSQTLRARGWIAVALTLVVALWATTAQAAPLIICNFAAFGGGPIKTYDFATGATVGSFVPTGASDSNNGRGVEVIGNTVYYTELSGGGGPSDAIHQAPFNGGAGGADIGTIPNPRPGTGIADLAFHNGVLYVSTGYPFTSPLQIFGVNPTTGAVVSGPVSIGAGASTTSDGLTVLPNGNFLINSSDASCTYNQFNPTTGALIPATTIVVPGCGSCTGVDTDGTSLYFQCNFNSFTQTTLAGALVANKAVGSDLCEDISLVQQNVCTAGTPGQPNCHGKCISALAQDHGGIANAASDLGFSSVDDLQAAVTAFCGN